MSEKVILYQNGNHWVIQSKKGYFEVYSLSASGTHGVRVASIGKNLGISRAKTECDKRESGSMGGVK